MLGMTVEGMLMDYLKFKGITTIGVLVYPILAPLIILFFAYRLGLYYLSKVR